LIQFNHLFGNILKLSYQNRVFNKQGFVFPYIAACNIDYFEIGVLSFLDCIVAYEGGQLFDHDVMAYARVWPCRNVYQ